MKQASLLRFGRHLLCSSLGFATLVALIGCSDPETGFTRPYVDSSDTRSQNLVQLLDAQDSLDRFIEITEETGLQDQLETLGPWTVFAPIDPAFERANYRLDTLFRSADLDSLRKLLTYHVVRGRIDTSDIRGFGDSMQVATLYDKPLTMHRNGRRITVNGAGLIELIPAQNGMLYVLDGVLELPPPDTSAQEEILFF